MLIFNKSNLSHVQVKSSLMITKSKSSLLLMFVKQVPRPQICDLSRPPLTHVYIITTANGTSHWGCILTMCALNPTHWDFNILYSCDFALE